MLIEKGPLPIDLCLLRKVYRLFLHRQQQYTIKYNIECWKVYWSVREDTDIGYPAVAYPGFCQEGGIFENFKKAFPARSKIFFNIGKTQKREGHDPMSPLPLNTPVLPGYPCRLALTDRITGVVTLSLAREVQSCGIVNRHDSTCCHLSRLCRKITTDLLLGYTLAKASIWDR